jgi:hypothetical protein
MNDRFGRKGAEVGYGGNDEVADGPGKGSGLGGLERSETGILKAARFDESDGRLFEGSEFLPSGRFDFGFGKPFGGGTEIESGFDEEIAHLEEFGGMPVGPGEVALDRLDGEEAAKGRRRESQEEGAPEEACGLG